MALLYVLLLLSVAALIAIPFATALTTSRFPVVVVIDGEAMVVTFEPCALTD
jgi:hypothetical protein